jgi:hypothetical protein
MEVAQFDSGMRWCDGARTQPGGQLAAAMAGQGSPVETRWA